jgi:hypothetical protein
MDTSLLTNVVTLMSQAVKIGGGIIIAWGLVNLGTNLKDHNGPAIASAIWQIVGGALVIAAGIVLTAALG